MLGSMTNPPGVQHMNLFHRFLKDEDGATAIEYALIAAFMAAVVIAGMQVLGPAVQTAFTDIATALGAAI
jgi:pilus assembly protein Flp/PilA